MLKVWNMSLVILTFLLTIFATFLTRSGLIESVHSFAQELRIAYIFLGFMTTIIGVGVVLVLWRLPKLRSENQIESFLSREAAFLFNNLILLGVLFAVMWGTLLPLLSEGLTGEEITVGPPFFNPREHPDRVGPTRAHRHRATDCLAARVQAEHHEELHAPGRGGAGGGGRRSWSPVLGMAQRSPPFGIAAFVLTVIVVEFFKGTRARARIEGENWAVAFAHLVGRNRRRWGGYTVHAGVVIIFAGFAGAAFNHEVRQTLEPGESALVQSPLGHSYTLTYEGMSTTRALGSNTNRNLAWQVVALLRVEKEGRPLGTLTTEKRAYIAQEQPVTEVGIRSAFLEDLYVILSDVSDIEGALMNEPAAQTATFTFLVNPLVGWIWYGGMILALGGLVALWPGAAPARLAAPQPETERIGGRVPVGATSD